MKTSHGLFLVGCSALALAGCGPTDIASPGTGGNVNIVNNPAPTPTPTPTPTSTLVTPAAGCPTIADPQGLDGTETITGPQGTWRVCKLPSRINTSITLPKIAGLLYQLPGRVDVGTDAGFSSTSTGVTLTIEPGVIIYGNTGTSWLAVNRGNRINAVGTPTAPIIFTSRDNVLGLNTETSQGQWGGVVLMGRAPITDCQTGAVASGSTPSTCERQTEGAADPANFGGANPADNSGTMKYVQIRYSGFVLGANSELQALTLEGVGSGTQLDYIQSYNSSDDGAEFFGGVVNMKHYIAVGADDDSLDMDTGVQANLQYLLLIQRTGSGDALMELDSNGNEAQTPRQVSRIANFTAVQTATSSNNEANAQAALLFRGNSDISLYNGVVVTPANECIRLNGSGGTANRTTLLARSVVMSCNSTKYLGTGTASSGGYTAADVATLFGSGQNGNNDAYTSTLTGGFINGANETAVTPFDVTTLSSFFSAVTYIGAVKDSNDTWYAGWTCNSGAANFGSTSGSCLALPTT
ncbi:Lipoprotein [Novosphingobium lubricantis]